MSKSKKSKRERRRPQPGRKQLAISRDKRDEICQIERQMQVQWAESRVHEVDVPDDLSKPKYFVTFPYPYMNGKFHLGHAFTMSKPDFYARYKRMKGFHVLYPFGLHCTGQPIVSGAVVLKREIEEFGCPPNFPEPPKDEVSQEEEEEEGENSDEQKVHAKQSRERQWRILLKSGVTADQIPQFQDPSHWIRFFPSHAKEQLSAFGMGIDFRRTFITTSANPYYDAFVRWQFNLLKKLDLVRFGKRMSVVTPSDGDLCPDHARQVGEHVIAKEFVMIKLQLCEEDIPSSSDWDRIRQRKIYLGAATLRPETMYGQTNCWLLPDGIYGAYPLKSSEGGGGGIVIVTERAARNLAYQDQLTSVDAWKESLVPQFQGRVLFGCRVRAPLCQYEYVHVLPMTTINVKKTTGVVTSVPSDSPDDYVAYHDLRSKAGLRELYGVEEDWVRFPVVNIIRTSKYGDCAAKSVVEAENIRSQKQVKLIKTAHDAVYKEGFYRGTMIVGEHAGMPVRDAKDLIRDAMIASGDALPYYEPENLVVSRSGEICVAAWTDQWYITYGEESWKAEVLGHVEDEGNFETFNAGTRKAMVEGVNWLREWGCSRTFGLGSKVPFDPEYLIESLSDSTIYMCYYTIAHFLQGDIFGKTPGSMGIRPEDLTDDVFEFVFRGGPMPSSVDENCPCPISEADLVKMRESFEYWYPVDLRVSAKELVKNHLVMFLYNHAAILGKKFMPRGVSVNGWVLYNGVKMSKSSGVFILLEDAVKTYSADAVRIALAAAGDSLTDANFETNVANNSVLDLHTFVRWCRWAIGEANDGKLRSEESESPEFDFFDKVFEEEMKQCVAGATEGYDSFRFMKVVSDGWYGLKAAKDRYEVRMGRATPQNMREDLVRKFVEVSVLVMAPIIPHTSEYIWTTVMGNSSSIVDQAFPEVEELNWEIVEREKYLLFTMHSFRLRKKRSFRKFRSVGGPNCARIFVAPQYEDWQIQAMAILRDFVAAEGEDSIAKNIRPLGSRIREVFEGENCQMAMEFLAVKRSRYFAAKRADPAISIDDYFSGRRTWDELAFWNGENVRRFVSKELAVADVRVFSKQDPASVESVGVPRGALRECLPGFPVVMYDRVAAE